MNYELAGSTWGASTNILQSSALALCCSAAEYCAPVWSCLAHTNQVDVLLNSTMRLISGTLCSTSLRWLPVLSNIEPPALQRKAVTNWWRKLSKMTVGQSSLISLGILPWNRLVRFSAEDETIDSPRLRQHRCGILEEPGPQSSHLAVQIFLQNHGYTHSISKIWRKAKLIAVEKPGKNPSLAANYRPISVLSVCYKLLECLALQRISPTVGLLSPDQAGFRKGRSTCDQVAALTTFIKNGFQQNLKTGAVFLDLIAAYDTVWHTGLLYKLSKSMPYWFTRRWVCCFEIDVSGCTWATTPVLGDPSVTAFLNALSMHRFCSTCTPTTCQLHVAKNSFMLMTYVSPFKANTSANWNAVSRQIWRRCHTSVDSGDLNQAPPKQSAVCSNCIIPAPPVSLSGWPVHLA